MAALLCISAATDVTKTGCVLGQEAARMSLAGEAAAETRRYAVSAIDAYSVRVGALTWLVRADLDLEANDNILFASSAPEFDLIVRPQVNARMAWWVSEKNSVNAALGTGYSIYAVHPEFNRLFVVPGSELSFDLYVGDFWIDLHERLSITKDAYQDPTAVGGADYSQLQNTAGLTVNCDLNKLMLRFGYDHANYNMLSGEGGLSDGDSDIFALSAAYRLRRTTVFGVETGGGWIGYSGTAPIEKAVDWNIGSFVEAQPTEYISVKGTAGYTVYKSVTSDTTSSGSEFTGIYARLEMDHRVNRYVEYSLTGGRNISFGFYAGTVDMYTASLEMRWHLFQKLSLSVGFGFEHGTQVLVGRERFDRFGPHVAMERPITAKMSGALRYQYYQRESDFAGGDYAINLVTLNLSYRL